MADNSHEQYPWRSLLSWLELKHGMNVKPDSLSVDCKDAPGAGKGLFVLEDCAPSTSLFTIPARSLINVKTLGSIYPPCSCEHELTAVQMISLHLLLHSPQEDGTSRDPIFGPYISTMPREFDSHPLTWSVKRHLFLSNPTEERLLRSLPSSVQLALKQLMSRFWLDWHAIGEYIRNMSNTLKSASRPGIHPGRFRTEDHQLVQDYLWAWLNVNTRCIHYRLDPSTASSKNITLCPVLDFANHTHSRGHIIPVLPSYDHKLGGDYAFQSSSELALHKGQEIFLRYGGHANRTLFVEYGFVNLWAEGTIEEDEMSEEVDVQDLVEVLFERSGEAGAWMKRVLEDEGYWGDWTMHSSPAPAHPSYRLIAALRLYHCLEADVTDTPSDTEKLLEPWEKVIQGYAEFISQENEDRWRSDVVSICERIIERSENGVRAVAQIEALHNSPNWLTWMKRNIQLLWREELEVARGVIHSIQMGEEF